MLTDLEKNAIRKHYGILAENLPTFRPRAAQREMIAAIAQAFSATLEYEEGKGLPLREGESIVVVEGPTGVGKSLAYLIAGGVLAHTRGKSLIVSSATIALQEQLVNRDLPLAIEKSGLNLTFALVKGRGRYLCPYRLYKITQYRANMQRGLYFDEQPSLNLAVFDRKPTDADLDLLHNIADAFAKRQYLGDRDEWPQIIPDYIWKQINNDRYSCLKSMCPNRSECPFYLAREAIEKVDVVVVNHDLLLLDISMGGGVILPAPEKSFYCIDEAHHLPKKANSRFAAEHSMNDAQTVLDQLEKLTEKITNLCQDDELNSKMNCAIVDFGMCLSQWFLPLRDNQPSIVDHNHVPIWLWEEGKIPKGLEDLVSNSHKSSQALKQAVWALNDALLVLRRDKQQSNTDANELDTLWMALGIQVARVEQIAALWSLLITEPIDENEAPIAKWITFHTNSKGGTDWFFHAGPVNSAIKLVEGLWRRAAGALLTSATLRSLGSFDLLLQQTGLSMLPKTTTLALNSPFDFAKQGELYIPPLQVSPKDADAHTMAVLEWLPKLISTKEAVGTLVLFTSRKQMQEVAARLSEEYTSLLLVQGEQSKTQLLDQHQQNIHAGRASILFGLDSFAEGLDLPSVLCVHVIIVKLPFAIPEDPIAKTLSHWIKQRGKSPFMEQTVPEASLKLIQAVGRLIRSESDYGRITILDNRIINQGYGRKMLMALPPFKLI